MHMYVHIERSAGFVGSLLDLAAHLDQIHLLTLVLGIIVISVVLAIRRFRPGWPGALMAMVLVGILLTVFHLNDQGVHVVGAISGGLPPFHPPQWNLWHQARALAPDALAITILGLMEANSISRTIADHTRQRLNVNRGFIGQGLANLSAAFFSGYPSSGSFTRSALNFRSGATPP